MTVYYTYVLHPALLLSVSLIVSRSLTFLLMIGEVRMTRLKHEVNPNADLTPRWLPSASSSFLCPLLPGNECSRS